MKAWEMTEIISTGKVYAGTVGGLIGGMMTYAYGDGGATAIKLFIVLIAMDWMSGIAAAKKDGSYSSQYGITGIYRTVFLLLFPAAGYYLDVLMSTPNVLFYFIVSGLAFHIANSVAANVVRAGWSKWVPKKLMKFVESEIEAKNKRSLKNKRE